MVKTADGKDEFSEQGNEERKKDLKEANEMLAFMVKENINVIKEAHKEIDEMKTEEAKLKQSFEDAYRNANRVYQYVSEAVKKEQEQDGINELKIEGAKIKQEIDDIYANVNRMIQEIAKEKQEQQMARL